MAHRCSRVLTFLWVAIAAAGVVAAAPAVALAQSDPYEGGGDGQDPATPAPAPKAAGKASIAVLSFSFQQVLRSKKVKIVRGPDSAEMTAEETEKYLQGETNLLTDKFITSLVKSNKFKVVEREQLQKIMDEQGLSDSGAVDPAKAVELGKLLGAEYLLMGTISLHEITENYKPVPGTDHMTRFVKAQAICDIKIVNSTTGRIIAADNAHAVYNGKPERFKPASGIGDIPSELTDSVHRQLIETLVNKVLDAIYPSKVIGFTGGVMTINRGDGTGIAVGQKLAVYMLGEEMTDPDTGETLGAEEIKLCEATVIQVLPKFSKAKVNGAVADVPVGSIVRVIGDAPAGGSKPAGGGSGGKLPGDD